MKHPDLRSLVWGKHLLRLLGVCGVDPVRPEPAPRLAHPMPVWFQRITAALTLFGIVGVIHFVDAALRTPDGADSGTHSPDLSFDASTWQNWSPRLAIGMPTDPPERPDTSAAATIALHQPPRLVPVSRFLRPQESAAREHRFQLIQVTAYTSAARETDDTPELTATNSVPAAGSVALSRDLLRNFTPGAPFAFGDKLLIPGVGVFEATDTMHPRWKRKGDIWVPTLSEARAWGRRTVFVTRVSRDAQTIDRRPD